MSELAGGALSPEASWELDLKGGKLLLSVKYAGQGGGADLALTLDSAYFLDKLAEKIPGQIDDAVFSLLKAAIAAA
jgi:hypothetical protein